MSLRNTICRRSCFPDFIALLVPLDFEFSSLANELMTAPLARPVRQRGNGNSTGPRSARQGLARSPFPDANAEAVLTQRNAPT